MLRPARILLIVLMAACAMHPAFGEVIRVDADEKYLYKVKSVTSMYDGDSIKVVLTASRTTPDIEVDFGFGDVITITGQTIAKDTPVSVRMYGFDTPELRDKRPDWKAAAYLAKDKAREWIDQGIADGNLMMRSHKDETGKFGRYLANFMRGEETLKDYLISNHLAVDYFGASKDEIAAAHQANVDVLKAAGQI